MKLVRSDSLDLVRSIASSRAWASRNWYTLGFACAANLLALFIASSLILSVPMRAAAWLSLLVLLASNGYVLWRARASHRRWVIVGRADRLYVRMFARRHGDHGDLHCPDVLVLEAPEIASVSIRSVDVFLYGPKPKIVDWLEIEPAQAVAEDVSNHVRPLMTPTDQDRTVLVAHEDRCLTIEWKWWRPDLHSFLRELARECPSVVIAPEERSELDLNGIWHGIRNKPDSQQRRMLVQAKRLGFGCKCAELLSLYKRMPLREAGAYLAEIEREETGAESSAGCSICQL